MKVTQCVEAYLDHRHACGYECTSAAKLLRRFARLDGKLNISLVTGHHLDDFLSRAATSGNAWQSYYGHLRRFFAFWFVRRQVRRIPQPKMKGRTVRIFYPHIYSRTEIRKLLDATAARLPRCRLGPETLKTIILLLYGTGIKLPDALALLDTDVDLTNATIQVGRSSAFKSRAIPIGRDVKRLLKRHLHSNERSRFGPGLPLFLTKKGTRVQHSGFWRTFRRLRRVAKVERSHGAFQPRIYDLRHTFAVHSIAHWKRKGVELDKMLPLLAAYLGNLDLLGMQRYVALSPCSYQSQLERLKV
jgi:integrase/recombinase XerD